MNWVPKKVSKPISKSTLPVNHDSNFSNEETTSGSDFQKLTASDALTQSLKAGAQKMLKAAIEHEVESYVSERQTSSTSTAEGWSFATALSRNERSSLASARLSSVNLETVINDRLTNAKPLPPVFFRNTFARQNRSKTSSRGFISKGLAPMTFQKHCSHFSKRTRKACRLRPSRGSTRCGKMNTINGRRSLWPENGTCICGLTGSTPTFASITRKDA